MDDVRLRVGQRIKQLRLEARLTQEALGERASVSYKFIGEVERGVGNPTVDTLQGIAAALEVDVSELFLTGARATTVYPPLTVDEYAAVREAKQSLDDLLSRLKSRPKGRRAR